MGNRRSRPRGTCFQQRWATDRLRCQWSRVGRIHHVLYRWSGGWRQRGRREEFRGCARIASDTAWLRFDGSIRHRFSEVAG